MSTEKLKINKQLQKLVEETIEVSQQLLELSQKYDNELNEGMVLEHIELLKNKKIELQRETKKLEEKLFT